jgi:alkaline phosphatase
MAGKDRLVGTAQVATTLQQARSGYSATDTNGSDAKNAEVPTLTTMTLAAINVLSAKDNGSGMFLQIEGGAVDWAAHANQTSRLIEEQIDFNNAVDAVMNWVDTNSNWNESLLIITTDHGNAMPSGTDSNTVAHDRIDTAAIAAGTYSASNPEGVRWWSGNHTNELVPLFARGAGAELFDDLVDGTDTNFATYYADWAAKGFDGSFVDNTDVFTVTSAAAIPEASTMALVSLASLLLPWRNRRKPAQA